MTAIQTCTAGRFDYLNPEPSMVNPIDLAVHLSRINRFLGATSWCEWSVAQHCLLASIMVEEVNGADVETPEGRDFALDALLHDATEAYCGDMPSPLRMAMRELILRHEMEFDPYMMIYRRAEAAVAAWASRTSDDFNTDLIKHVDLRMLATERHLFVAGPWIPDWIDLPDAYVTIHDLQAPADITITSSLAAAKLDDGAPQRVLANRNALMWMPMQPHEAAGQWFARLHQLRPDLTEPHGRQAMPWLRWPKWADDVVKARQRAGF